MTCRMACPGVYKPGPDDSIGKCYTYDVLTAICIKAGHIVDVENAEENWEYRGGCFENGSPVLMERAVPGKEYAFDYVPIEVRADDDPYTVVAENEGHKSGLDLSFFKWLGFVFFSYTFIAATIFLFSFFYLQKITQNQGAS